MHTLLTATTYIHLYIAHSDWTNSIECNTMTLDTGWRKPIRCLKLQVIFRKRATDYRALLWKMACKDKASYGSTPPCRTALYNTPAETLNYICYLIKIEFRN